MKSIRYSILIILSILLCQQTYAERYVLTVYGKLIDINGKGIPHHTIYINNARNSKFIVSEKAPTYENGEFKWPVYLHDTIESGVILLSYINCDNKEIVSEWKFSKKNPIIDSKLIYCDRPIGPFCATQIEIKRINDTAAIAYAYVKGKAPFIYKWSTGQGGDNIPFNPQNKIKICVVSQDADGCTSEACAANILPDCSFKIQSIEKIKDSLFVLFIPGAKKDWKIRWSTGDTTSEIRVTKLTKYCVNIITADNCKSEACIDLNICNHSLSIVQKDNILTAHFRGNPESDFYWSTGETGKEIRIKEKGTYCVKVQDKSGCGAYACIEAKGTELPCTVKILVNRIPITTTDAIKKVKLSASTTIRPKLYYWNTGDTTESITVLKGGEYCVTVSDGISCKTYTCIKLEWEDNPVPGKCELAIIAHSTVSGELTLVPRISGKAPYSFLWITGSKDERIVVKTSGKYCLTIKDATGCVSTACIEVSFDKPGGLNSASDPANAQDPNGQNKDTDINNKEKIGNIDLNVFPNPVISKIGYRISTNTTDIGRVVLQNMYGQAMVQRELPGTNGVQEGEIDVSHFMPGLYIISVQQKENRVTKKIMIIR